MAKNKFYVVKKGRKPGIYESWTECEEQIKGFSGAIFKGFPTLQDAENFFQETDKIENNNNEEISISDYNSKIESSISQLDEDEVIAFVDGSYSDEDKKSAFGVIIIDNKGNREIFYKAFPKEFGEDFISTRNVGAELAGVKEAIGWAIQCNKTKIQIYYDYEGIEKWANGEWNAKNIIAKEYVSFIKEAKSQIDIIFSKVPAHSGIIYNEQVDTIAQNALSEQGYKTYNDGSVYFIGYNIDNWKEIIDIINHESIDNSKIEKIEINVQQSTSSKETMKITQGKSIVTINCYHKINSYVQGKQTALFHKIISLAIEMSNTTHTAIKTLNKYYGLELTQKDIETEFKKLFPNFKDNKDQKLYNTLLSACYNTKFNNYMPDYTCLATPIFRGFEYYLHRILGDYMGLSTSFPNGGNNFRYFDKKGSFYECNNPATTKLSKNQLDYLNLLYTQYNSIRHQYSHWSADSIDTAVIDNIETAHKILLDGIELIDKFYINF